MNSERESSEPGERYTLERLLGEGAMGEVLLARDLALTREVAYKRLHRQMAASPLTLRRFVQEAQITAQLDHPNIVPIYHLEKRPDGQIAYTMKPIAGQTLKELIAGARAQFAEQGKTDDAHSLLTLLGHFLKVCDAMHFAHSKQVIHRDLKPANLMVGPYGEVYVMDWGIAKVFGQAAETASSVDTELAAASDLDVVAVTGAIEDEATLPLQQTQAAVVEQTVDDRTRLGQILGTLRYMSPQQAAGKNAELDGFSDQFALGLILFEIITLKPAIKGSNQIEVLKAILGARLEACEHVQQIRIPRELKAIVAKATALKPEQRYADVAAMAADLRRFLRGEAVLAQPDNLWQQGARWLALHPRMALLLVAGTFLLSAGVMGMGLYRQQQNELVAQYHAAQLSDLLLRFAEHSSHVDRVLLQSAGILRALVATSTESLLHGPAQPPPLDLPEVAQLKLMARPQAAALEPRMQGLLPDLITFFLWGPALGGEPLPPSVARQKLQSEGSALQSLEVRLDQGLRLVYPMADPSPPGWLDETHPAGDFTGLRRGEFWSKPYQREGHLRLACQSGLFDYNEQRLGYARIELSLDYLTAKVLPMALPGVQVSYLLDQQGLVLLENQQVHLAPVAFGVESIRQAARTQQAGYLEAGDKLYLYRPLPSIGWLQVLQLDAHLLERPR